MKNYIYKILILSLITTFGCTKNNSGEKEWTGNLVTNGSFEDINQNTIVGWENVDTTNISHDVPEGGGNNSLLLYTGDIEIIASQSVMVPMTSNDYSFSCYVKENSSEGFGSVTLQLMVQRGGNSYIALEKEMTGTFDWTYVEEDSLNFNEGDTVNIIIKALGDKDHSVEGKFDLVQLGR